MTARRPAGQARKGSGHSGRPMQVGIVGAGVMAEAMITGLLADKAVRPTALVASHPRRDRRATLAADHHIRVVARNRDAVAAADIVVLAVKPQMLRAVMRELAGTLRDDQVVLSIVAGATLRTLSTVSTKFCLPASSPQASSGD